MTRMNFVHDGQDENQRETMEHGRPHAPEEAGAENINRSLRLQVIFLPN